MTRNRVPELDLLRIAACLSVLGYHYTYRGRLEGLTPISWPAVECISQYGFLGVQAFFLLSGWLVSASALERNARQFAVARFVRIVPTFWVCCLCTTGILVATGYHPPTPAALIAHLSVVPLAIRTFLPSEHRFAFVDPVYWTLGYEIRYYVVVGILVAAGKFHRFDRLLWAWIAGLAACSTGCLPQFVERLFMANYGAYFVAGAFLARVRTDGWRLDRLVAILLCLGLCLSGLRVQAEALWASGIALHTAVMAAVVATIFVLLSRIATRRTEPPRRRLDSSWTYSAYLLHQFAGFALMALLPGDWPGPVAIAVVATVVVGASVAWSRLGEPRLNGWFRERLG